MSIYHEHYRLVLDNKNNNIGAGQRELAAFLSLPIYINPKDSPSGQNYILVVEKFSDNSGDENIITYSQHSANSATLEKKDEKTTDYQITLIFFGKKTIYSDPLVCLDFSKFSMNEQIQLTDMSSRVALFSFLLQKQFFFLKTDEQLSAIVENTLGQLDLKKEKNEIECECLTNFIKEQEFKYLQENFFNSVLKENSSSKYSAAFYLGEKEYSLLYQKEDEFYIVFFDMQSFQNSHELQVYFFYNVNNPIINILKNFDIFSLRLAESGTCNIGFFEKLKSLSNRLFLLNTLFYFTLTSDSDSDSGALCRIEEEFFRIPEASEPDLLENRVDVLSSADVSIKEQPKSLKLPAEIIKPSPLNLLAIKLFLQKKELVKDGFLNVSDFIDINNFQEKFSKTKEFKNIRYLLLDILFSFLIELKFKNDQQKVTSYIETVFENFTTDTSQNISCLLMIFNSYFIQPSVLINKSDDFFLKKLLDFFVYCIYIEPAEFVKCLNNDKDNHNVTIVKQLSDHYQTLEALFFTETIENNLQNKEKNKQTLKQNESTIINKEREAINTDREVSLSIGLAYDQPILKDLDEETRKKTAEEILIDNGITSSALGTINAFVNIKRLYTSQCQFNGFKSSFSLTDFNNAKDRLEYFKKILIEDFKMATESFFKPQKNTFFNKSPNYIGAYKNFFSLIACAFKLQASLLEDCKRIFQERLNENDLFASFIFSDKNFYENIRLITDYYQHKTKKWVITGNWLSFNDASLEETAKNLDEILPVLIEYFQLQQEVRDYHYKDEFDKIKKMEQLTGQKPGKAEYLHYTLDSRDYFNLWNVDNQDETVCIYEYEEKKIKQTKRVDEKDEKQVVFKKNIVFYTSVPDKTVPIIISRSLKSFNHCLQYSHNCLIIEPVNVDETSDKTISLYFIKKDKEIYFLGSFSLEQINKSLALSTNDLTKSQSNFVVFMEIQKLAVLCKNQKSLKLISQVYNNVNTRTNFLLEICTNTDAFIPILYTDESSREFVLDNVRNYVNEFKISIDNKILKLREPFQDTLQGIKQDLIKTPVIFDMPCKIIPFNFQDLDEKLKQEKLDVNTLYVLYAANEKKICLILDKKALDNKQKNYTKVFKCAEDAAIFSYLEKYTLSFSDAKPLEVSEKSFLLNSLNQNGISIINFYMDSIDANIGLSLYTPTYSKNPFNPNVFKDYLCENAFVFKYGFHFHQNSTVSFFAIAIASGNSVLILMEDPFSAGKVEIWAENFNFPLLSGKAPFFFYQNPALTDKENLASVKNTVSAILVFNTGKALNLIFKNIDSTLSNTTSCCISNENLVNKIHDQTTLNQYLPILLGYLHENNLITIEDAVLQMAFTLQKQEVVCLDSNDVFTQLQSRQIPTIKSAAICNVSAKFPIKTAFFSLQLSKLMGGELLKDTSFDEMWNLYNFINSPEKHVLSIDGDVASSSLFELNKYLQMVFSNTEKTKNLFTTLGDSAKHFSPQKKEDSTSLMSIAVSFINTFIQQLQACIDSSLKESKSLANLTKERAKMVFVACNYVQKYFPQLFSLLILQLFYTPKKSSLFYFLNHIFTMLDQQYVGSILQHYFLFFCEEKKFSELEKNMNKKILSHIHAKETSQEKKAKDFIIWCSYILKESSINLQKSFVDENICDLVGPLLYAIFNAFIFFKNANYFLNENRIETKPENNTNNYVKDLLTQANPVFLEIYMPLFLPVFYNNQALKLNYWKNKALFLESGSITKAMMDCLKEIALGSIFDAFKTAFDKKGILQKDLLVSPEIIFNETLVDSLKQKSKFLAAVYDYEFSNTQNADLMPPFFTGNLCFALLLNKLNLFDFYLKAASDDLFYLKLVDTLYDSLKRLTPASVEQDKPLDLIWLFFLLWQLEQKRFFQEMDLNDLLGKILKKTRLLESPQEGEKNYLSESFYESIIKNQNISQNKSQKEQNYYMTLVSKMFFYDNSDTVNLNIVRILHAFVQSIWKITRSKIFEYPIDKEPVTISSISINGESLLENSENNLVLQKENRHEDSIFSSPKISSFKISNSKLSLDENLDENLDVNSDEYIFPIDMDDELKEETPLEEVQKEGLEGLKDCLVQFIVKWLDFSLVNSLKTTDSLTTDSLTTDSLLKQLLPFGEAAYNQAFRSSIEKDSDSSDEESDEENPNNSFFEEDGEEFETNKNTLTEENQPYLDFVTFLRNNIFNKKATLNELQVKCIYYFLFIIKKLEEVRKSEKEKEMGISFISLLTEQDKEDLSKHLENFSSTLQQNQLGSAEDQNLRQSKRVDLKNAICFIRNLIGEKNVSMNPKI